MSRLPDEFRHPNRPELDAVNGGQDGDRAPQQHPERACDRAGGEQPEKQPEDGPAPRVQPSTAAVMARYAANEARRAGRGVRQLAWIRQRPPSPEDRYARLRRVAADLDAVPPLLRVPYLGGEYLAATVATILQLAAQSVATLPGLLTTAAVIFTVLQLALGVPF